MKKFFKNMAATIRTRLQDRLFLFRLFVTILCVDFIAFLALGSINPLQLLNPARFLWAAPADSRTTVELYFPRSFHIDSIGKAQPVKEVNKDNIGIHLVKVQQKMHLPSDIKVLKDSEVVSRARLIMHELILGPQNLQAKKFIKDRGFIRDAWFYEGKLVISLNYNSWYKMSETNRTLALACFERSIKANVKQVQEIQWDI